MSRNVVPGQEEGKAVAASSQASGIRQWVPKLIVADSAEAPPVALSTTDAAVSEAPVPQDAAPIVQMAAPVTVEPPPEPVVLEPDPELLDQARAEGYALGLQDGRRQAEMRDAQELQALKGLLGSIGQLRAELESSLSGEVLSLAVAMARQIVRQSLTLNPEAIVPVLREALMVLPALNHQTVLHLHPEDAALVKPLLSQDPVLAQSSWRVVEDGRMERGGCRLETPESEVDATLATRWGRVLAALGRDDSWQADKPA